MRRGTCTGFTMVELMLVFVVVGMVLAFAVPPVGRYLESVSLRGAADQINSALLMARSKAMATRTSQVMQFQAGYSGTDYRIEVGGVMTSRWTLPKKISYPTGLTGTITSVTMTPDGRCSTSGLVILQNTKGLRDTVSVMSSGLILRQ